MSVAEILSDDREPTRFPLRLEPTSERADLSTSPLEPRRRARARDAAPRPAPADFITRAVAFLPDLERWARQLTTQPSDAKDLIQDTYRRALEAHQQFHPGSDLRSWLGCILRNLHRDRLRRSWREVSMGGDDVWMVAAPTPEPRPLWSLVTDEELDRALGALSPVYRTPYVLHTVHGRSYNEIAKEIGIPPGTIGSRIHRARALLRRNLVKGETGGAGWGPEPVKQNETATVGVWSSESPSSTVAANGGLIQTVVGPGVGLGSQRSHGHRGPDRSLLTTIV